MSVDRSLHQFFLNHRAGPLTSVFKLVTHLGSSAVLLPLVVVVGVACWARRRSPLPLVLLASTYAGALVLEAGLKRLVGRPRPPVADRLVQVTGYAFPSGHATVGTAVWTAIGILAVWALRDRARRWAVVGAVGTVVAGVDLSRVYLGVHWPSDVVVGSVLGGAWTVGVFVAAVILFGRDKLVDAIAMTRPSTAGPSR